MFSEVFVCPGEGITGTRSFLGGRVSKGVGYLGGIPHPWSGGYFSSRYASYWNALLFCFQITLLLVFFYSVAIRSSAIYLLRGQGAGACHFFHYLSSYIPRDAAHRIITLAFLMVCLHCPTSKQIQKPRQREIQINSHRTQ